VGRENTLKKLGDKVRQYREAAGLSQEALGNQTELGRTYISGVERGIRNPSVLSLERIAKALGVKTSQLIE
jgi:transcriptional regulator with XRE-family HTH domain